MKNRLIYILSALMAISVLGIIALQSIWVSSAIAERKKEFATHVNNALNAVNDAIDEDEAVFFLEEKLGPIDSLLQNMIVLEHGESDEVKITYSEDGTVKKSQKRKAIFITDEDENEVNEFQIQVEQIDSGISLDGRESEFDEKKLDQISSVVKRFSFESKLTDALKDRISMEAISTMVQKYLANQGITSKPEIAVYNVGENKIESGFRSDAYNDVHHSNAYSKRLFPNDRSKSKKYTLHLQFANNNDYVWSGIRWMMILCILFTLLILFCFSYSLYSIFKQKRISEVKNDFINNMTHELKTPLASISLAASSIQHPKVIRDQSEIHRFTEIIKSEERRINAHVERVLDVAALDKSDLKMDFSEIDLHALVQRSLQNVDLSLSAVNGTVEVNSSLHSKTLQGDAFHLGNVFTNILDNSIKYSNPQLHIVIDLSETATDYLIRVEDNGIGMSKKSQKLAFDKFYRAETGNIHTRKGFGLGLSYVKSIVEAHRGTVTLTSELNVGTSVTITLPKK